METQGGKQMEEGKWLGESKRGGRVGCWNEETIHNAKTTYNRHMECVRRCKKIKEGLVDVMMETTEERSADEKTSAECRGWSGRRGSSYRRLLLIGRGFCAVAGAALCKNDTDTCQILLLLFPAAQSQGRIELGCQTPPPLYRQWEALVQGCWSSVSHLHTPTRHKHITATPQGGETGFREITGKHDVYTVAYVWTHTVLYCIVLYVLLQAGNGGVLWKQCGI